MKKLTVKIKVGDVLRLKENLEQYVTRTCGYRIKPRTQVLRNCCRDPQYSLHKPEGDYFKGKDVIVMDVERVFRYDNNIDFLGIFEYIITSRNTNGTTILTKLPLEFINHSYPLKRNGHKISIRNKELIVG